MMCSGAAAALQEGDAKDNALTVSVKLVSVIRLRQNAKWCARVLLQHFEKLIRTTML